MACLFNNIRGFMAPRRIGQIANMIRDHRFDLICLQETMKSEFSPVDLRKLGCRDDF
jgi:hypothetical protein